jgi:cobalt/nickel transport system permease protein
MKGGLLPPAKVRFVTGFLMICMAVTAERFTTVFFNLLFAQLMLFVYRVPHRFQWQKLKPLLFFFVFAAVIFPLTLGSEGIIKAAIYCGRLFFVAQMLAFLFYQTSNEMFLKTLSQLKIPDIFIEMILFTLRFMDVFTGEIVTMKLSLQSKGFFAGKWFHPKKYMLLGRLLGSMLHRALSRSERIYLGMKSRGYTGSMPRLEAEAIPIRIWVKAFAWLMGMSMIQIVGRMWSE